MVIAAQSMSIPVYFSFARSGGTLVNKLLGAHPDCLVLSEVNPSASYKSVISQTMDWLGLISVEEAGSFGSRSYGEQIVELHRRAAERQKTLVVRDWVSVNFLPGTAGCHLQPSGVLEQVLYLRKAGLGLTPFVVSRRAHDVFFSIRANFGQFSHLDEADFASAYLAYAQAVSTYPVVQLERIQKTPDESLSLINDLASLSNTYRQKQLAEFGDFDRCTGDNTLRATDQVSASARPKRSIDVSAKNVESLPLKAETVSLFAQADKLLGYE